MIGVEPAERSRVDAFKRLAIAFKGVFDGVVIDGIDFTHAGAVEHNMGTFGAEQIAVVYR
ncbi:hypothetical protein D3C77_735530 [compost metagenome]